MYGFPDGPDLLQFFSTIISECNSKNDMSLEQKALVLQQAVFHPLVRPIAKSAGLLDNNDFIATKNYI